MKDLTIVDSGRQPKQRAAYLLVAIHDGLHEWRAAAILGKQRVVYSYETSFGLLMQRSWQEAVVAADENSLHVRVKEAKQLFGAADSRQFDRKGIC